MSAEEIIAEEFKKYFSWTINGEDFARLAMAALKAAGFKVVKR
jgi:hypothetical protein